MAILACTDARPSGQLSKADLRADVGEPVGQRRWRSFQTNVASAARLDSRGVEKKNQACDDRTTDGAGGGALLVQAASSRQQLQLRGVKARPLPAPSEQRARPRYVAVGRDSPRLDCRRAASLAP